MNPLKSEMIVAALLLPITGACTAEVGEKQLLRPIRGESLSQAALAAAAPVFALKEHVIIGNDGTKLHAIHLTRPDARATILYFGGNGYTVGRFGAATASALAALGTNIMIVDHRGYGASEGRPSATNILTDGVSAFDYLSSLPGVDRQAIIVHGQSLGSFIAGHVAAYRPAAGVVLESSITTTEEWAKARAGSAPVRVRVAESIKTHGNLRVMPLIEEDILLLVGEDDKITPPGLSRKLFDASPLQASRKAFVVVSRAGHNDVLRRPAALDAYKAFLNRLQLQRTG